MKILMFILMGLFTVACLPEPNYEVCKFSPGNMVRSILSKEVGQVIGVRKGGRNWCYYHVRFLGNQEVTNSKVLSNDGAIVVSPLRVVPYMRPYELELWD